VFEVPLMIRFPEARHAGKKSNGFVQHHDITAAILEAAGVESSVEIDGMSFLENAAEGKPGRRDHATVGWGSAVTVISDAWWFNSKADGTGVLLYDLRTGDPSANNVADEFPDVVHDLYAQAIEDAGGGFPGWIIELAASEADAPGCSDLVARA
jgi:arylsulfatase A-like enzyme